MSSTSNSLLVHPELDKHEYITVTPESAGWEHLHFKAVHLQQGEEWQFQTGANELALVILGGKADVSSDHGDWKGIGSRTDVFHGMPTTLYLSRNTDFTVKAVSVELDFACGWAKAERDFPPRLIRPEDTGVEYRGGDNASRQINQMILPGFPCDRLVVVEVYTPSGNWSSYPPHKHDKRRVDAEGRLIEADLEEVYFYKIDKPEGYAYQRIYTDDRRLDELMLAQDSDLVLSPEGYHPVVSAQGYTTYYLNILAGSDQSLTAADDPAYAWVKSTWKGMDPRIPVVTIDMNSLK
jgi:5-deoxy-glucuronate isomerase